MKSYPWGHTIKIQVEFRNEAGVLTNPTTTTLKTIDPAGVLVTYAQAALTNPSTGKWNKSVLANKEGIWHWRWEGTGAVDAVDEGSFEMLKTQFAET